MLEEGRKRIKKGNVSFYKQNAESLSFANNSYDKYLVSFCLRNISDIDKSLKEAFRILKPGGQYVAKDVYDIIGGGPVPRYFISTIDNFV